MKERPGTLMDVMEKPVLTLQLDSKNIKKEFKI
jgi:hypothetical protein